MDIAYKPRFKRTAELVNRLARAAGLLQEIRSRYRGEGWVPRARREALVRHAHYSSRIEGNPLTLPEVRALAEGRDVRADGNAKREILNYLAAMRWIGERAAGAGISEKSLLKVHSILTSSLLPGRESGHYKTVQNAVYRGGRVIYRPPPPEAAPILTRALLRWVNSAFARREHPVIVAAIAHHRLVSIHPVLDGNGRLARLLEAWLLYAREFDIDHIFALPEFYETERERYYGEIQKARDNGDDLTSWLDFVAEGVVETLEKTVSRLASAALAGGGAAHWNRKQEAILSMLSAGKPLTGPEICSRLDISRALLSRWMKPLIAADAVIREGKTKGARYRKA
jgi:Fic family protein